MTPVRLPFFVYGTLDATDFFFSTPDAPYENPGSAGAKVNDYNPLWESFDLPSTRG